MVTGDLDGLAKQPRGFFSYCLCRNRVSSPVTTTEAA
jgi:hypothetical protein